MQALRQQWFAWSQMGLVSDHYEMNSKRMLGGGNYGSVVKVRKIKNKQWFAMRIVVKSKVRNKERFKSELSQLRNVNSPCVCRILESYEDARNIYIVQELCEGGTLYERILERHVLSLNEAKSIIQQLLSAVQACHQYALCHRDLRPDSFLYLNYEDLKIKTIDFAQSMLYVDDYIKKCNNQIIETSRNGKPYYIAPEILEGRCTETSDIWALGVIIHLLLTGELPFKGQTDNEIMNNIQSYQFDFKIQGKGLDLIQAMLQPPSKRITLTQALNHEYLKQDSQQETFLNINFKRLKELSQQNQLKRIMLNYISEQVPQEHLNQLQKELEEVDTQNNGLIPIQSLTKIISNNSQFTEFAQVLQQIKCDNDLINYQEFLNQVSEKRLYLKEERIYSAFKHFDLQATGRISLETLWKVLTTNPSFKHLSKEFCKSLIQEVDKNNDGEVQNQYKKIDYLEFIDMFFQKT